MTSKRILPALLPFYILLFPLPAIAISTITAIPPKLEIEAEPGETIKSTLKIRNDTGTQQNFSIFVNDFIVDSESNTPIPLSENITNRWSLRKWIIAPTIIPIDSNQTQNVNITIRVPASALPGGHYAMVTYMPNGDLKPSDLKDTSSLIGQRVGTILYLKVKGDITEKAFLKNFSTPNFNEKGPISFQTSIENLSDIHISPKGYISIKDFLNNEVTRLPIETGNIFPESTKNYNYTWEQKWGYGRYSAEINLVYGNNNILTGLIYFWLFPISAVIYTLVAIASIAIIIILLTKRNKKHQEQLEEEVRQLQKEIQSLEKR